MPQLQKKCHRQPVAECYSETKSDSKDRENYITYSEMKSDAKDHET